MLEIKIIRNDKERILSGLRKRNWSERDLAIVDRILIEDQKMREYKKALEASASELKQLSAKIGTYLALSKKAEMDFLHSTKTAETVLRYLDNSKKIPKSYRKKARSLSTWINSSCIGVFHLEISTNPKLDAKNVKKRVSNLKKSLESFRDTFYFKRKSDEELSKIFDEVDNKINKLEELMSSLNSIFSELVANQEQISKLKKETRDIKTKHKSLESAYNRQEKEVVDRLLKLPNCPHESVPPGKDEKDNFAFKLWEKPFPTLPADAQPHWELAKKYNLFDLDLGVKLTGAGFPVFRGKGARLQRALIQFFLDEAVKAGFEEIIPPHMVNEDTARGTGQLPDKEAQMYYVERDNLYLIPTAEVPVTNILRDAIIPEKDLPIKMTAYTPCFRREAGSYGAHVRGLNRVHQFDKVEIVIIEHPEKSYKTLKDLMLPYVSSLLDKLDLPYRILLLCGGDMGFSSALTFDFEVWSAAQQRWLEVSSVSNFETFQSNRMKLRFKKDKDNKPELAHTLNGSALALARIVAALLENNQTPEGIVVPKALHKYTGFKIIN